MVKRKRCKLKKFSPLFLHAHSHIVLLRTVYPVTFINIAGLFFAHIVEITDDISLRRLVDTYISYMFLGCKETGYMLITWIFGNILSNFVDLLP